MIVPVPSVCVPAFANPCDSETWVDASWSAWNWYEPADAPVAAVTVIWVGSDICTW